MSVLCLIFSYSFLFFYKFLVRSVGRSISVISSIFGHIVFIPDTYVCVCVHVNLLMHFSRHSNSQSFQTGIHLSILLSFPVMAIAWMIINSLMQMRKT